MKMKEESEKGGLKLNIQKTKIMVSGPITSWQIEGEKAEAVADFIFLDSKITAHGDWSSDVCSSDLWLQSPSTVILEPKKIKSATASTFSPSICHEVMGPDATILGF